MSGSLYRSIWAKPFSILLCFIVIGTTFKTLSKPIQWLLCSTLFITILLSYSPFLNIIRPKQNTNVQKSSLKKLNVTLGNHPYWIATVEETSNFIKKELGANELFLAIPYDPLYYYLTDKKSPTRQLIFFEHINIPHEQERDIIKDLKENNVNYILITTRAFVPEPGLGYFGKTYCPVLGEYIKQHFTPIFSSGDKTNPGGWEMPHGTTILERKDKNT